MPRKRRPFKDALKTRDEIEQELAAEAPEPVDFYDCDNHIHIPWTRGSFDGTTVTLGRICRIPDDNGGILDVKQRSAGTTKITYEPGPGRLTKEGF